MKELIQEIGLALAPEQADARVEQVQPSLSDIEQPVIVRTVITGDDCLEYSQTSSVTAVYCLDGSRELWEEMISETSFIKKINSGASHFKVQQFIRIEPEYQGPDPDIIQNSYDAYQARSKIEVAGKPTFIDDKAYRTALHHIISSHKGSTYQSIHLECSKAFIESSAFQFCLADVARKNQDKAPRGLAFEAGVDAQDLPDGPAEPIMQLAGQVYLPIDLTWDVIS